MLPKTNAYIESYDGRTKSIYFLLEDNYLLEKYDTIWNQVRSANCK